MKTIIVSFFTLAAIEARAAEIHYTNFPQATVWVTTKDPARSVSARDVARLRVRHSRNEAAEVEKVKIHVESQLDRQVIEVKCEPAQGFDTWSEIERAYVGGLKSKCTVSFI